jgi:outer membrane protein assembly factor BamB
VFVGSSAGYFYALDELNGALKWQYPSLSDPPLVPPGSVDPPTLAKRSYGIQSSASYWDRDSDGAVIFGAQDPTLEPKLGSARLYALNARTGTLIWKSDPIATINGTDSHSLTELHERIRYSSPLIFNNHAYVGIADAYYDRPLQNGRVVAVDLPTGRIDSRFSFIATGTHRGGAVWNSIAADGNAVFFTTGNTRHDSVGDQNSEPFPNYGLSMVRVDKDSGAKVWSFQPVPYLLDDDPDWAAGATVMSTSCGELIASVQKDGWAYAVDANSTASSAPNVRWQFPPTGYPFTGYTHGSDDYKHPGAAWNDVLIAMTGGESLPVDGVQPGYGKLQALNACATDEANRVRWIANIPDADIDGASGGPGYAIGVPTVTGGIIFIGTDTGHLVVLADPSVWPPSGSRCSSTTYPDAASCQKNHYVLVPIPTVLANVALPDGGDIAGLRDEPALADGRVFVATDHGHVYMLAP